MAMKHMIGFERNAAEEGMVFTNFSGITNSIVRSGSYAGYLQGYSGDFYKYIDLSFASGMAEFYIQFAFYIMSSQSATRPLAGWYAGATLLGGLKFNHATNAIDVYTGNFATLVGSCNAINISTWYVAELYIKIADSGGAITLRLDGITQVSHSGDTKPGEDTAVNKFRWGSLENNTVYIDDIIVNDTTGSYNNSWPSGAKIVLLKPNADGSTKQWTPSAGSDHYALVDEVTPSATDYLQSTSAGEVEELSLENLPAEALSIAAVKADFWGLKGSTTAPTQVKLGVRKNGSNYMSSAKDLSLAQGQVSHIIESDPEDGSVLTPSEVDSLQLVLESV